MHVTTLRCEYRSNPLGIDVLKPRLSWQLQSDRRGARQTAYQILAARVERDLLDERALLWDTGKVPSDQSIHVTFEGQPLSSGQRVWWKVRVWDENDEASSYSAPAWWETGLLHRSEWKGEWIGASLIGGPRTTIPCPFLRKELTLEQPVVFARLYATSLGLYEFHINGHRVGEDVLAPGWTDYRQRVRYQVYDVTRLLARGANILGAILGDGWYCGNLEWSGRQFYGDRPKLLAQLHISLVDGSTMRIVTDGTWKTAFGPILESDLLLGESYDARLEFPGWDAPGFDDSHWQPVEIFDDPEIALVATNTPPVRPIQELHAVSHPVEIPDSRHSRWLYDFGQNMVGRVRLKINGSVGTTIVLRHGEMLNPDGILYTENLRTARQTDHYTLCGEGEEIYEPRFTFHGFRYVEVSGYLGTPPRDLLTGVVLHSNTPPTGTFECSNPLINQLQHNIVWGQKGNFVDVPTDCPQRDERLGWTGDAQVFIRTATFNMDVAAFFTKWQQDLADAQYPSGAIPPVAPLTSTFETRGNAFDGEIPGGPAWEDAFVICPWTIFLCYSDRRLLETHYDALTRFVDFLARRQSEANPLGQADEQLTAGFGDWLAMDGSNKREGATAKDLIGTAFFAYTSRLMSHIAAAIAKPDDAKKYEQLYQDARRAFTHRYVTPEGRLVSQTQTAYVLALQFDLIPEHLRPVAIQALVRDIEERKMHLSTGFVGTPYLPHVLTNAGRLDIAYALLNQKTWPSWLYSVTQGATTIWERWDGWTHEKGFQDPKMNSFNHYAYGSIGAWLYAVVAGIDADPDRPGYKHIVMRPRPGGGLTNARAVYDSIHGRIVSDWRIDNQIFDWHIVVPPNTTATVYVPVSPDARISEGGIPAEQAQGVTPVHRDIETAIYEVLSGSYYFHVRNAPVESGQNRGAADTNTYLSEAHSL